MVEMKDLHFLFLPLCQSTGHLGMVSSVDCRDLKVQGWRLQRLGFDFFVADLMQGFRVLL